MLSVEKINNLENENNMLRDCLKLQDLLTSRYKQALEDIKIFIEKNDNYFSDDILTIIKNAEV